VRAGKLLQTICYFSNLFQNKSLQTLLEALSLSARTPCGAVSTAGVEPGVATS